MGRFLKIWFKLIFKEHVIVPTWFYLFLLIGNVIYAFLWIYK
jgi:hypothetical protein